LLTVTFGDFDREVHEASHCLNIAGFSVSEDQYVWRFNIDTDVKEIDWERVDYVQHDRNKWQGVVSMALNLQVPMSMGIF
jgi:hypothetical protein